MKVGDLIHITGYPGYFPKNNIGLVTAIIPSMRGNRIQFIMRGKYIIMHESDLEVLCEV
jgi:hypothetical protein